MLIPSKTLEQLKSEYLEYYRDVPVQKYAAMAIGRNEDTIIRWKQRDKVFAEAIQVAKADFIRKRVLESKAEFALERLAESVFSPKAKLILHATPAPGPTFLIDNQHLIDQTLDMLMDKTKQK